MGLFRKNNKQEKIITISGAYFSSHPEIHGYKVIGLDFGDDGVLVHNARRKKKRIEIKRFGWDEIIGFEANMEDKSQLQTSQRVTATRMATIGVFALAAPKKENNSRVASKFYDVLHTTSGDISLEEEQDSGTTGGDIGNITRNATAIMIARRKAKTDDIRRLVAENAKGRAK